MSGKSERRERGSALLVTVMLLALMGLMGIAALDTSMRDQQVAGYHKRSRLAFYAAEAGVAQAQNVLLGVASPDETPALPLAQLGDAGIYPHGRPAFQGDPAFANPIRSVGTSLYSSGGNLRGGRPQFTRTFWQINVRGNTPDGATTRIEVVVSSGGSAVGYGG